MSLAVNTARSARPSALVSRPSKPWPRLGPGLVLVAYSPASRVARIRRTDTGKYAVVQLSGDLRSVLSVGADNPAGVSGLRIGRNRAPGMTVAAISNVASWLSTGASRKRYQSYTSGR